MTALFADYLPERLKHRLQARLPGPACWSRFLPELCYGRHAGPPPPDVRAAAVLALLFPEDRAWRLPLIVRPETMLAHAGQVSLPGGELEGTETVEEAALRECREELGTTGGTVEILGRLSPVFVFASNFLVTPVVAWTPQRPTFAPEPAEVAHLLEPTLNELLDPGRHGQHTIERRSLRFRVPHIRCGNFKIWGATSLMLAELLALAADEQAAA